VRLVIDTNVLVSGLLSRTSPPAQVWNARGGFHRSVRCVFLSHGTGMPMPPGHRQSQALSDRWTSACVKSPRGRAEVAAFVTVWHITGVTLRLRTWSPLTRPPPAPMGRLRQIVGLALPGPRAARSRRGRSGVALRSGIDDNHACEAEVLHGNANRRRQPRRSRRSISAP